MPISLTDITAPLNSAEAQKLQANFSTIKAEGAATADIGTAALKYQIVNETSTGSGEVRLITTGNNRATTWGTVSNVTALHFHVTDADGNPHGGYLPGLASANITFGNEDGYAHFSVSTPAPTLTNNVVTFAVSHLTSGGTGVITDAVVGFGFTIIGLGTGTPGAQGPAGPTGPAGADGIQGMDGLQGPQGSQGQTGPSGALGFIRVADEAAVPSPPASGTFYWWPEV